MSSRRLSPIFSSLSDDPEMREAVEGFVGDLEDHVRAFERAVTDQNTAEVTRLAHYLKSTSGACGFEEISETAAALEQSARVARSIGEVATGVMELMDLCRRVTAQAEPTA